MRPGRPKPLAVGGMLEGIKNALEVEREIHLGAGGFSGKAKRSTPWSDMPVWVPPTGEDGGLGADQYQAALDKGLTFRPLAVTARDTLAWFKSQPKERQEKLRAGITPEREAEVLLAWHKTEIARPDSTRRASEAAVRFGQMIACQVTLENLILPNHEPRAALLQNAVDVRPNEVRALWLGFAFHFLILTGYYILRPIRDSIAASNRLETLPWMFTATLVAMLLANAALRRDRGTHVAPEVYSARLRIFHCQSRALFRAHAESPPEAEQVWIGRGLYVWVSVFNLFNTAIFWAFMTDLFTVEQGKRLYGFIAVGGSLGAIAGPTSRSISWARLGRRICLVDLRPSCSRVAGFLVRILSATGFADRNTKPDRRRREAPIGGIGLVGSSPISARSPYLLGSGAARCCSTRSLRPGPIFNRSDLAREASQRRGAIAPISSRNLEIWVNSITVLIQIFLTGRLLKWFGVGFTLVAMPFLSMVGFAAMGLRRVWRCWRSSKSRGGLPPIALLRPSREILFTVLRREDKYKVEERYRHSGIPHWRPDRCLVLWRAACDGAGTFEHQFRCRAGRRWLVCAQHLVRKTPGRDGKGTRHRVAVHAGRTALSDFVFAQATPGFCDEDVFQGRLGQRDGIDLARKRRRQASDEAGAVRMFDPHFVVQDVDFHA